MEEIIIKGAKGDVWQLLEQLQAHQLCAPLSGVLKTEWMQLLTQTEPHLDDLMACADACKITPTTKRLVLLDCDISKAVSVTGAWAFLMVLHRLQEAEIKFDILLSKAGFSTWTWGSWLAVLESLSSTAHIKEGFWFGVFKTCYIANLKACIYVVEADNACMLYTHLPIDAAMLTTFYQELCYSEVGRNLLDHQGLLASPPYQDHTLDAFVKSMDHLHQLCFQGLMAVMPHSLAKIRNWEISTHGIFWDLLHFLEKPALNPCTQFLRSDYAVQLVAMAIKCEPIALAAPTHTVQFQTPLIEVVVHTPPASQPDRGLAL